MRLLVVKRALCAQWPRQTQDVLGPSGGRAVAYLNYYGEFIRTLCLSRKWPRNLRQDLRF